MTKTIAAVILFGLGTALAMAEGNNGAFYAFKCSGISPTVPTFDDATNLLRDVSPARLTVIGAPVAPAEKCRL